MNAALDQLLARSGPLVLVRIAATQGSSPREQGALMLVSRECTAGTVGGGRLEQMAVERARDMLATGETEASLAVPLGPEIGQCCGGFVRLGLARLDASGRDALEAELRAEALGRPHVYVFGAGHVGAALARALLPMPLRVVVVDSRPDFVEAAPAEAERRCLALPETALATAPNGSAVVVLTHDHGLDFQIAQAALAEGRFAYVGMIGSKTKRAMFRRFLDGLDRPGATDATLRCPIGGSAAGDKRPEIIATLVAGEVAACLFAAPR